MNKRYRVIFNEATQTYTAVAEDVPAKGKKASKTTKALMATAIGLGATTITYASWISAMNGGVSVPGSPMPTPAIPGVPTAATSGVDGIALGTSNVLSEYALAGANSIAIGKQANADYSGKGDAFAIGHFSTATEGAFAFGNSANANGLNSMALGHSANASGNDSMALGYQASATGNNIALGSQSTGINNTDLSGAGVTLNNKNYDFAAINKVNTLSVGSVGAERVITNVAAGKVSAKSTQAVNGSQLHAAYSAIGELSEQTWSLQVNSDPKTAIASDDVVTFKDGKNIKITRQAGTNDVIVGTADDVFFNSVGVGTVSINSSGINAGSKKIIDVANGDVTSTSKDAVNGSQLHTLQQQTWNVQVNDGAATAVAANAVVSFKDGDNISVIQDPNNPNNIIVATKPDVAFDSVTVGSVVLNNNGINAGNQKIIGVAPALLSKTSKEAVNGSQLYATNSILNQTNTKVTNLESQTWKIKVNNGDATAVAANHTVNFNEGKNIKVIQDATDSNKLTIATKDDVIFKSIVIGDGPITIGGDGPIVITQDGINGGGKKITNIKDGLVEKNSKDGVNGGQLYDLLGGSELSWNLIADNATGASTTTKINATKPLAIKGDGSTTKVTIGKGADGKDTLTVSSASPLQYVDDKGKAAADQFKPTDNIVALMDKNGTTAADVTLTNVKDGAIAATSKDAINGSQLYAAGNSIGDIIGGGSYFNDEGKIVWDNKLGGNTYNGIGNTGADNIHDAIKYLNEKPPTSVSQGWIYALDGNKAGQVEDNGTFDFSSTVSKVDGKDFKNIEITNADSGSGIQLGLAKDIGVESITVGETKIASNGGNLQIGQGTISSGRTGSIGLGDGYKLNADNSLALGNGSVADTPVGTASTKILGTEYKFAGAAPKGTVSVGSLDNERTITNVAAGRLTETSTDAVNGSQLYATNTAIEKLKNGADGVVQYADPDKPTTPNGGTKTNTATLVGKDADKPVTLTNVAAGKNGTDAVNVSQLKEVEGKIGEVGDRANAGAASAMATAMLPQAYDAGSSMLGVAAADFDGEQGYALGYSSVSEGGKWVVRAAGTANSQEKFGVGAGIGYRWG